MKSLPENHIVLFPQEKAFKYLQHIFHDKQQALRRQEQAAFRFI